MYVYMHISSERKSRSWPWCDFIQWSARCYTAISLYNIHVQCMSPFPLCSSGDFIKFVHDQMEQSALSVTTFLPDSKVALVRHTEPNIAGKWKII